MKAIVNKLTCAQLKSINKTIRQNVSEEMQNIQLQLDALWLNAVRLTFGLGEKRLKRVYKAYFDMRREYIDFYQSDGYDGMAESGAIWDLHNNGCDIKEWYEEFGTTRVDYRITKGESQQLREAKERAKNRNSK